MSEEASVAHDRCPNCGADGFEAYCRVCGEKRLEREDWKLSAMLGEAFDEITDIDRSKVWRTFSHLLLRPGELTAEYWRGRRKRYLGPIKLYLVLFTFGLVLYSIHRPTSPLNIEVMASADRTGAYERILGDVAKKRELPRAQIVREINSRWQGYVSLTQFMGPIGLALVLKLLFLRRKKYYAEHLIFSLHLATFSILLNILVWCFYLPIGISFAPSFFVLLAAQIVVSIFYFIVAVRRAYGASTAVSILTGGIAFTIYSALLIAIQAAALVVAIKLVSKGG